MKNKIIYPNYDKSILQIPNSILKYYDIEPFHSTSKIVDDIMCKRYKNVVFMIFDGMGSDCIKHNSAKKSFINKHKIDDMLSLYPSTTTAVTASMLTGLSPKEHGWIGWSLYFDEEKKAINIFINDDSTKSDYIPAAKYNIAEKYMPFKTMVQLINENNDDIKACVVSPYSNYNIRSLEHLFSQTKSLCEDDYTRYIYTYWNEPDSTMHKLGCYDTVVKEHIKNIDAGLEELCNDLEDTLIIVSADHGLIDIEICLLDDYPQIYKLLSLPPSMESRCVSFFVKDGKQGLFKELFLSEFGDAFKLYTKEEFIKSNLLGYGTPHKKTYDFLGNFIAVAISNKSILYRFANGTFYNHKGSHAGMSEKEMLVPLIIYEC